MPFGMLFGLIFDDARQSTGLVRWDPAGAVVILDGAREGARYEPCGYNEIDGVDLHSQSQKGAMTVCNQPGTAGARRGRDACPYIRAGHARLVRPCYSW